MPLDVDVGIGEARVLVPDDVCVATDAEVGMGNVHVLGLDHGGVDVDLEDAPDAGPTVDAAAAHADIGMGELRVQRQPRTTPSSTTTASIASTTTT